MCRPSISEASSLASGLIYALRKSSSPKLA